MKYTVEVNEKSVVVTLDGYKGVAKCCEGDTFNLQTGIELALERAKVAKANANKPKSAAKPTIAEAKAILENYVGDHVAIIGKGETLSNRQKRELWGWAMKLAPECAPKPKPCCDECDFHYTDEEYDKAYDEGYDDGYADGYDEGCNECDEVEEVSELAKRMIARINEILGG